MYWGFVWGGGTKINSVLFILLHSDFPVMSVALGPNPVLHTEVVNILKLSTFYVDRCDVFTDVSDVNTTWINVTSVLVPVFSNCV